MAIETKVPSVVLDALVKGRVVFFGEFRKGAAVEFEGRANKKFHQSKCTVETGEGVITVAEFLPDSVDWKTWVPLFKKGDMVYGVCTGLDTNSGAQVANAKLFPAT